jgi:alanyl-tRNA synthetase
MSPPLSADQIRERFLSFFAERGHKRVASSSLVPANDPTLLFTNAGMVQFKDVFTGREQRPYSRATTSQKCVRAGGKHNDLDNVGFTARHHTFFEMLGNFSFGDYFKPDAVKWGWELVTQALGLPKERLAVTVFKGEEGIPADEEAAELWAKAGVPKDRIFRLGLKDNFWAMGDTGPCGPCSEIYFYMPGADIDPRDVVGESDNWVEIWNLVFMQFERKEAGGKLIPLPKPSIDTGAGLERVACAVQGKTSNYDTDLFTPLLKKVEQLSGRKYGGPESASMRVIADHSRAAAFLIGDGVLPSPETRGYTLRRIMRRAIFHGAKKLEMGPFMHETVAAVIDLMAAAYPELKDNRKFILEATRHEEESFRRTLDRGVKLIEERIPDLRATKKPLGGADVWFLYDTHGIPADLTRIILQQHGLDAQDAKKPDREDEKFQGGESAVDDAWMKLAGKFGETKFLGYEATQAAGNVLAVEGEWVLTDQTPFYGESGGQVGDTGTLGSFPVLDTQKHAGLIVHKVKGSVAVGQKVELKVDVERRDSIRRNHSATHLLHKALKTVLGEEVKQKGSIVAPDYLRFDFSCFKQPAPEQLERVEDLVNQWIRENQGAQTKVMAIDEAKASGAVALFGEKYGDKVRVVTVHPESTELCGGTHVKASGDIGLLKITGESSIASGVRRITAVTGKGAVDYVREMEHELKRAAEVLKAPRNEISKRIEQSQKRLKELEKKLEEAQLKAQSGAAKANGEHIREVNGIKVLTQQVDTADAKLLRGLADRYRDQLRSGVVGLGGPTADGKALLLVAATKDLVEKGLKAGDLIRELAGVVGGTGGGKPDMAQAGGSDPSKIPQALERLHDLVKV